MPRSKQATLTVAMGIGFTGSLAILLTSGILAFGLATYLFNWDRRNSTQRGHPLLALLALLPYVVGMLLL